MSENDEDFSTLLARGIGGLKQERDALTSERDSLAEQLEEAKKNKQIDNGLMIESADKLDELSTCVLNLRKQLAESKRQNAKLCAALALTKRALILQVQRREAILISKGGCVDDQFHVPLCDPSKNCSVCQTVEALALKPADCLAPVREALKGAQYYGHVEIRRGPADPNWQKWMKVLNEAVKLLGEPTP